jgi:hypothetical protein
MVGIPDCNRRSFHVSAYCISDQFCICGLNHRQFFMNLWVHVHSEDVILCNFHQLPNLPLQFPSVNLVMQVPCRALPFLWQVPPIDNKFLLNLKSDITNRSNKYFFIFYLKPLRGNGISFCRSLLRICEWHALNYIIVLHTWNEKCSIMQ